MEARGIIKKISKGQTIEGLSSLAYAQREIER